jgi:hypothetical protein
MIYRPQRLRLYAHSPVGVRGYRGNALSQRSCGSAKHLLDPHPTTLCTRLLEERARCKVYQAIVHH